MADSTTPQSEEKKNSKKSPPAELSERRLVFYRAAYDRLADDDSLADGNHIVFLTVAKKYLNQLTRAEEAKALKTTLKKDPSFTTIDPVNEIITPSIDNLCNYLGISGDTITYDQFINVIINIKLVKKEIQQARLQYVCVCLFFINDCFAFYH